MTKIQKVWIKFKYLLNIKHKSFKFYINVYYNSHLVHITMIKSFEILMKSFNVNMPGITNEQSLLENNCFICIISASPQFYNWEKFRFHATFCSNMDLIITKCQYFFYDSLTTPYLTCPKTVMIFILSKYVWCWLFKEYLFKKRIKGSCLHCFSIHAILANVHKY